MIMKSGSESPDHTARADLGLRYSHMSEEIFSHGAVDKLIMSLLELRVKAL